MDKSCHSLSSHELSCSTGEPLRSLAVARGLASRWKFSLVQTLVSILAAVHGCSLSTLIPVPSFSSRVFSRSVSHLRSLSTLSFIAASLSSTTSICPLPIPGLHAPHNLLLFEGPLSRPGRRPWWARAGPFNRLSGGWSASGQCDSFPWKTGPRSQLTRSSHL